MFLLIHITMKQIELDDLYFTFHDVSINTSRQYQEAQYLLDFTFHDVSINTGRAKFYPAKFLSLHSTMFLLIRCYCHCRCCNSKLYIPRCFYYYTNEEFKEGFELFFTFHDVSINTQTKNLKKGLNYSLHSTMFLLIPYMHWWTFFGYFTLHSTMFLLIHLFFPFTVVSTTAFTFHDVSINTS